MAKSGEPAKKAETGAVDATEVAAWSEADQPAAGAKAAAGSKSAAGAATGASAGGSSGAAAGALPAASAGAGAGDPVAAVRSGWRGLWQVPALVASLGVLGTGAVVGVSSVPEAELVLPLERVGELIGAESYQSALDVLNAEVYPYLSLPELTDEERGEYHRLVARAVSRWQRSLGIDERANHETIARHLVEAEAYGAVLTDRELSDLALSTLALGDSAEAEAVVRRVSPEGRELKLGVLRALVDHHLGRRTPDTGRASGLLVELLTDASLPVEDRLWATARQSDLLLAEGGHEEVITRLLRELPRYEGMAGGVDGSMSVELGGLYLRLGRAYLAAKALDEAGLRLRRADELVGESDELRPGVLLALAQLDELALRLPEARDRLVGIQRGYATSPELGAALLRLAEVEAALGAVDASLTAYGELSELLRRAEPPLKPTVEEATASLLARGVEQMTEGAPERAMRFAAIAGELNGVTRPGQSAPAAVLEALASGHRGMAEASLGGSEAFGADGLLVLQTQPVGVVREAQRHLMLSGHFGLQHAEAVAAFEPDAYAASLWSAAESFDMAGDREGAQRLYRRFVDDLPEHERHAEARFRLGRVYQALGDHANASGVFGGLVEDASDPSSGVASWGLASRVPLAQSLLADGNPENDAAGEELLTRLVSGELADASGRQFGMGLLALADRLYATGRYAGAVERYEELVTRAGAAAGGGGTVGGGLVPARELTMARFRLADSYRRGAGQIEAELSEELSSMVPEAERRRMRAQREESLRRALSLLPGVRQELEAIPEARRTELEEEALRNAVFYLGDCAFDLGEYELAVRHYQEARQLYEDDPASLVALTQIVGAHLRMNDVAAARVANTRARMFFESLPDEVWDDPTLPMGRQDWERWLDSQRALFAAADAGAPVGGTE